MKINQILLSLLFIAIGCNPLLRRQNLFPVNYLWFQVDSVEVKTGGMVKSIVGNVISDKKDILEVDSLSATILEIQKKPNGTWCFPPGIFYKQGEIVTKKIYKVIYTFSEVGPKGQMTVGPFGM
jgi:hypothetical protein